MVDRPLTNQRPGSPLGVPGGRRSAVGARPGPRALGAALLLGLVFLAASPPAATLAAGPPASGPVAVGPLAVGVTNPAGGSLESAASRAGDTGRKIGLSLIGLALAVAAVILVFKRDFKEAVGVIAIGIVAVLLVSPAGINVLRDTVSILFGSN
ncbi:MAG: hypothetical protein QOH12_914 [Solirubrobacteraceae bacterium]|jgi:hypothetical protein|nr:hypothetical protein [Solirubrobacteraceae bacterium]